MAERKSAVREVEIEIDESARSRREKLQLAALGVGVLAVIALMFVISGFLSAKDQVPVTELILFGATVVIMGLLLFAARRTGSKKA